MPLLNWLTRNEDIHRVAHAPYRLLEEAPKLSYGNQDNGNMLIQGDNLDALKALLPYYAGKVKCIFIDPPYNTRSAFEHYDDNLEHSQWLAMMYPRLELLRDLLSEDGSIWVTIDDNEAHYLKVVCDEIFGRSNFVANCIWQKTHTRENRTDISTVHDNLLVFAKNHSLWKNKRNPLPSSQEQQDRYTNPDGDRRGPWASLPVHAKAEKGRRQEQFYTITGPTGKQFNPPVGNCWRYTRQRFEEMIKDNRISFGVNGSNAPRLKKFRNEVQEGLVPSTIWFHNEVGTTGSAKTHLVSLFPEDTPFSTPKPEPLIQRVLHIATNSGDLVLDSFVGSGTTGAVAHKMGRRYIGIEMGDHAVTHCAPRLRKVIDGEQGGISEAVGWKGGGGFRFYRLGDPVFDEAGRVAPGIRFAPLAAHLWFVQTGVPFSGRANSPLLGDHEGIAYYLLYNGILGDKRPNGGNILTSKILAALPSFDGPKVIFGEGSRLSAERLTQEGITFRQIPYEIKAR